MATTIDESPPDLEATPTAAAAPRGFWRRFGRMAGRPMPKGLFARSLLIIIAPVVLLQALVAFVFMERNWSEMTARISRATVGDIAAIVDIVEAYPLNGDFQAITAIAASRFGLNVAVLPPEPLPPPGPKPFFSPLDRVLSQELSSQIGKPFWIDTVGRSNVVEIRIQLADHVLRVFAPRSQTYASNSLIFISWMVITSAILLAIAIVFLRNQIKPILRLTGAVDDFGKGRAVADFPPRGAREVRQATIAFHQMRRRVERQIDQRTAMLAGVSHDLRTILTRLRLQLAFLEDTADVAALKADIDDMSRMLEGYLAFARGDNDEETLPTDIAALLDEIAGEARVAGHDVEVGFSGEPLVRVRPQSFKRCIANLVGNAGRHGKHVAVTGVHAGEHLTVTVDDDGPGVPFEEQEAVFKPFYRLDDARNLDETGTGLGLPIARDIARSHGGDIVLSDSPMGGLRATVTVPA
jgi:two-component system osmolarity sensor histidine kinase EnvZ